MRFYFSRPEQYAVAVLLVAIAGALLVLGVRFRARERAVPVSVTGTDLLVHVAGAVRKPGVYRCQSGELVFDALAKAGGVSENSAPESLELTAPLENGCRVYVPSKQEAAAPATPTAAGLRVYVTGAVNKPGVYTCQEGAIVEDALKLAGGPGPNGCPDALNLAAPLTNGCQVNVPSKTAWKKASREERQRGVAPRGAPPVPIKAGAATPPQVAPFTIRPVEPAPSRKGGHTTKKKSLPTGRFSLNTATLGQLTSLPGIGDKTAQRILDYRKTHGKFTDLAELLNIPRIGPKTYERIVPYLTL